MRPWRRRTGTPAASRAAAPGAPDIYEVRDRQIGLISTGPTDSGGETSACRVFYAYRISVSCPVSISDDGTRVLFWTNARLVGADTDTSYDVYLSSVESGPSRDDYPSVVRFCRAERKFLGGRRSESRTASSRCGRASRLTPDSQPLRR